MNLKEQAEIKAVKELGERIGYGQLITLASALWAIDLEDKYSPGVSEGAFVPTLLLNMNEGDAIRAKNEQDMVKSRIRRSLNDTDKGHP
jgi:hypothetical protein